jgi:sec-independent protein translocase protein TatC
LAKNPEKRAELFEHLTELRGRLVRSLAYITVGMVAAYFFYKPIYHMLTRQMDPVLKAHGGKYLFTSITEPFMLRMQVSFVAGLILVSPLVTIELWRFISPGLTRNERRPLRWMVPLSIFLFLAGASLCYYILPFAFRWFAAFLPSNAVIMQSVPANIRFVLLMLLAFGCAFELPVVLMLLAQLGIVNSKMLKDNWRHSVVGIAMLAAIFTPSNDVISMATMAVPMVFLYLASIWLVKLVERKPRRE